LQHGCRYSTVTANQHSSIGGADPAVARSPPNGHCLRSRARAAPHHKGLERGFRTCFRRCKDTNTTGVCAGPALCRRCRRLTPTRASHSAEEEEREKTRTNETFLTSTLGPKRLERARRCECGERRKCYFRTAAVKSVGTVGDCCQVEQYQQCHS
jgi:hypothetical protein